MRALTISAHGGLDSLEYRTDVADPHASPGTVRVRIKSAALNHLDVFMLAGLPGVNIVAPWVMGADGAGVIDEVGEGVSSVVVGDAVVINPGISDGTCEFCLQGEQSECVRFGLLGEHRPGTLADYVEIGRAHV